MDVRTRDRLIEQAIAIEKLRSLEEQELEWLLPLLNRAIASTLDILEAIAHDKRTFEEIATIVSCSAETVSQKLNALERGGIALDLSDTVAYAPKGRPRKLARK